MEGLVFIYIFFILFFIPATHLTPPTGGVLFLPRLHPLPFAAPFTDTVLKALSCALDVHCFKYSGRGRAGTTEG